MKYKFKLLSSLEKVFFEKMDSVPQHTCGSMLKNEIYSFQLAAWFRDDVAYSLTYKIEVESELAPYIELKRIGYVPVISPTILVDEDDDYISKRPGLFPDPLFKIEEEGIKLMNGIAGAVWISVEPKGEMIGTYPIVFKILNENGEVLDKLLFTLEIINAELPKLPIYNTGWFHGDCLAALHNVEVLSEAYWEVVEKYVDVYVKFGHNMILTPVFTPPLDTAVGGERPTNQLVKVSRNAGKYSFDFNNLKRWIDMCHKHDVEYFEISHLFTQWGAKHTPKIMAVVDGEYKRIFGWETDSLSPEYLEFLDCFLLELVAFLTREGVMEQCFFHVSDEPYAEHEERFKAVKSVVLKYIDEDKFIEALSDYSFYEKGIVKNPVVASNKIHTFMENGAKNLWTYYCVSQRKDVANRYMAMPSYRNRILGYQLYKHDIKGFLQWGFNFWFSQYSKKVLNPYVDTSAGGGFPGGDSFIVYPMDEEGDVVLSLRLYVFYEGLQDLRAMKLLESLTDKDTVMSLLNEVVGFDSYPRNSAYIISLREHINSMIKEKVVDYEMV